MLWLLFWQRKSGGHGIAVLNADGIIQPPDCAGAAPEVSEFPVTVQIDRVPDDVIMDMGLVDMGADHKGVISLGEPLCKLHAQPVGFFRGNLAGDKGLPDYCSFGLADKNGMLTNAGRLLTDQRTVFNSRIFCTRWNGLEKGSIFDDALDDKEYEGSLIYLLQSGCEFIRNNSKVRFAKEAQYRVDKPDYAERAVTEAVVNALIHRDYIVLGSEIHIDMYDDRVEIVSPGGMFEGAPVQECDINTIRSVRRNPVIADLFHRMKYMERRGSGLRKIVSETEKLPGYEEYLKPEFFSTPSDFKVILKNVNYIMSGSSTHETTHDTIHDLALTQKQALLLDFCTEARSRDEMQSFVGITNRSHFSKAYLKPLLASGKLKMTIPDKPKSRSQKYITAKEQ